MFETHFNSVTLHVFDFSASANSRTLSIPLQPLHRSSSMMLPAATISRSCALHFPLYL